RWIHRVPTPMASGALTDVGGTRLYRIALTTGAAAVVLVHLAQYPSAMPVGLLYVAAALLVFPLTSYILARKMPRHDPLILPIVAVLTSLGLAEIYRLAPDFVFRQAIWIVLGAGLLIITVMLARDAFRLARYRFLTAILGLLFLVSALVFGTERDGIRQWIEIGQVSFQPSEIVKVLLVLFFASYLAEHRPVLSRHIPIALQLRALGPVAVVLVFSLALLAVQRDFGAAMLYFTIVVVMLYATTGRFDIVAAAAAVFVAGAAALVQFLPHVRGRFEIWLDPWADAAGRGYQLVQSLFGLGSGGLTGRGLGLGHPELVPAAHTDFISVAIGEELGFVGTVALVLLFMLLVERGFRIALRAPTFFTRLLAVGSATVLGVQSVVILAGTIRLVPLTGITLPFVSYGGSSIVSNFILLGLLLGVGSHAAGSPLPRPTDHRPMFALAAVFTGLFLAVLGVCAYWQVAKADELTMDSRNPRLIFAERKIHRGTIFDRRMRPIAVTETDGEKFVRRYPEGALLGHVTGYRSERLGKTGLELKLDRYLLGFTRKPLLDALRDRLTGRAPRGLDAVLTIDARLQRMAAEALGSRRGAVVAIDPRDGAVLAMVSQPGYDPHAIEAQWPALQDAPGSPLLNRATSGEYIPGSAFKVVTMAAALARGIVRPESTFHDPGSIVIRNTRITNFEGQPCGTVTFTEALARSCNVVFITVGLRTGGDGLLEYARAFHFGRAPRFDLPTADGHLPPSSELEGEGAGQMAFGQGSVLVTPLQMALAAAAIARGGESVQPYLVREVRGSDGTVVSTHQRGRTQRVIDASIAQMVQRAMILVVQEGTGRGAALPGAQVAGKTGTATVPQGESHAWFIGFAPAEAPRVVVAVVVEHGGIGGRVAAPIARLVLQEALGIVE
ncbi:MAG: FtsW/RodA/SpoVE family cell cycle protein, partial [bacterium]